jgi:hypothetical protein
MGLTAFNRARREAEEAQRELAGSGDVQNPTGVELVGDSEQTAPLDRDALKAEAESLGIAFAGNVPTARLAELVAAKKSESLT